MFIFHDHMFLLLLRCLMINTCVLYKKPPRSVTGTVMPMQPNSVWVTFQEVCTANCKAFELSYFVIY